MKIIQEPPNPKTICAQCFLPWTQSFHIFQISSHRSHMLAKEREKIIGGRSRVVVWEREEDRDELLWKRGRSRRCNDDGGIRGGQRIDGDGERKPTVMVWQIWKLVQLWLKRQRNQKLFFYLCYVIFVSFVDYLLLKWVWFEYLLLKSGICYFQFGLSLILQRIGVYCMCS